MDLALRCSHYIDPVTFELQRDVILLIEKGRIVETIIGGEVSGGLTGLAKETLDYEAALVLPGFVNAHCHLDLSHLARQLPSGLSFTEWIDCIIEGRKVPAEQVHAGIEAACDELLASGTTSVIDVSVDGASFAPLQKRGIAGAVCLEALGIDGAKADAAMERVDAIVRKIEGEAEKFYVVGATYMSPLLRLGFSPHAPYSTSGELYQHMFGRAVGEGRVLTTHVAESIDEQQFFRIAQGPIRDFYERRKIPLAGFTGYDQSPITEILWEWFAPWLSVEQPNSRLVLVHCNYPQGPDLDHLARFKPSIVYCPRSHAYFGHEEYPLGDLLKTGANLCLGTDSLASNDSLSMLDELRAARAAHPALDAATLFKMATVNGRKALDIAPDTADLVVLGIPANVGATYMSPLPDMLDAVLKQRAPIYSVIQRGRIAARAV
ncbi:MAG: amidohydrolase family protein [Planctomycetes bacterium]|nr:amidohydrolase family protein [Planctomycetota bacterium]